MITALLLIAVLVLVLLNGFFVAAEFALVRVRRSRIEEDAEQGQRGARMVVHQLDDLSRYLAACQLGITLTSLGIGFLGEPAVATSRSSRRRVRTASRCIRSGIAYLITRRCTSRSASRSQDLRDQQGESTRPDRPPLNFHARLQPVHRLLTTALERHAAAVGHPRAASSRKAAPPRSSRC
jgi:hypothetical protein